MTLARAAACALVALGLATPATAQTANDTSGGWFDPDTTPPPSDAKAQPASPAAARPSPAAPAPSQPAAESSYADTDPTALTDFKPALDPYGQWVQDPTYGVVWVPHQNVVGEGFAPYVTSGHWALTADNDWIWVSDYPFGWVVFHYGRWVWISGTGWAWIPGRQYAHAWVVWRVPSASYAYVGWAPAPPAWVWVDGVAVSLWFTPSAAYVFCPSAYVFSYHVHHHVVHDHHHVHHIARHTHRHVPHRGTTARAPSPAAARVPASGLPRQRTAADPRAVAASNRETAAQVLPGTGPAPRSVARPGTRASLAPRPVGAAPTGSRARLSATRSLGTTHAPAASAPASAGPRPLVLPRNMARSVAPPAPAPAPAAPRQVAPAPARTAPAAAAPPMRSTPTRSGPSPSFTPAPAMRSPSASPSLRSAPSHRAAPPMRSAPSLSTPRGGASGARQHRR